MSSGRYRYRLNGEDAPVEETWALTGERGGAQQVKSSRTAGDVSLAVIAELDAGRVQCCDIEWRSNTVPLVVAEYEQTVTGLLWRRTVGDSVIEGLINAALEGEVLLYPLMRIFTGPVITALCASGGEGRVLVPDISITSEAELLLPDISSRRVICEGQDDLDSHPGINCHRWLFIGGQYDKAAKFWLDDEGRMLRYQWSQSESQFWEVDLAR